METEILEIKFNESLSDSSIKMIKDILSGSLGFKTEIKRVERDNRLMHFKFDENQLIRYLFSFSKFMGIKLDDEDKGLIANYVMEKQDNFYEVEEWKIYKN